MFEMKESCQPYGNIGRHLHSVSRATGKVNDFCWTVAMQSRMRMILTATNCERLKSPVNQIIWLVQLDQFVLQLTYARTCRNVMEAR